MWKMIALIADVSLAVLLWAAAVSVRILLGDSHGLELVPYIKFGFVLGLFTVVAFTRRGLYEDVHFRTPTEEFFATLRANAMAFLLFVLFIYFVGDNRVSRFTLIIYLGFSSVAFVLERFAFRAYLRRSSATPVLERKNVVLVGNGAPLREYLRIVREHPHLGIEVKAWIDAPPLAIEMGIKTIDGSSRESLATPNAFVLSYSSDQSDKIDHFLREAHNDVVRIFVLPDLKGFALLGLRLEDFAGLPMLAINQPSYAAIDLAVKRIIDLVASAFGLLVLSPLFLCLAILIKLSSRGPIFFVQERMGLDGGTFRMYKFRTMRASPGSETGWTVANDPRRTKVGSFLRATSIDELPQLWNVFLGHMSLVGPRPEQPRYVQDFRNEIPAYMLRHKMKAGITGWAQVNGWRGDTSLHKRIECDLYYIKNWTLILDIKILFLTVWKGFVHKNAY
jgi:Undecaprenyl-phosphate glucose phosphotransferase